MKMIELATTKGAAVWVNPDQVVFAGLPDGAGTSMYGDNNVRAATRLHFAHGAHLDVREELAEVIARLGAD
jgi:hypothetical protein